MKKKITPPKKQGKSRSRKSAGVDNTKPSTAESWMMRLYVAGQSARSLAAIANLRKICDTHMPGRCTIEVIDLMRNPELAKADQIVAIPTLVRKLPIPVRRIIGDLSATDKVLMSLELTVV
ncbi:MAG: circadian clock KaiB family protein [Candidatus Binatus sp.]